MSIIADHEEPPAADPEFSPIEVLRARASVYGLAVIDIAPGYPMQSWVVRGHNGMVVIENAFGTEEEALKSACCLGQLAKETS